MTLSLARRADRFPDRTAVVDVSEEHLYTPADTVHEDRVTYGELSAIVTRTADRLASLGIGSADTVCVVTRNRVASIALLFSCRRLGATCAPISHRLTPATVERPFEALDPDLVVAEAAQRDLVRSIPFDRSVTLAELIDEERDEERHDAGETDAADPGDGTGPLLALHGEAGRPVVGLSARSVEWNCITALVTWGLAGDDSAMVCSPLSSSDGLFRVALPLLYAGGTVLLDRAFDPGDALTAIAAHDVTTLAARGTALRALAANEGFDAIDGLDRVICDAPTPQEVVAAYAERGVPTVRAYGRLECPVALSQSLEIDREVDRAAAAGVGRPVPDCRARLVDEDGAAVEGTGEGYLLLSGPVVADGYVNAAGNEDDDRFRPAGTETTKSTDSALDGGERGRFTDGWFDTGERFRRAESGTYHPR